MSDKEPGMMGKQYSQSTNRPGPCFLPLLTSTAGLSTIDWKQGSSAGLCAYLRCSDDGFLHISHTLAKLAGRYGVNFVNLETGKANSEFGMIHAVHIGLG